MSARSWRDKVAAKRNRGMEDSISSGGRVVDIRVKRVTARVCSSVAMWRRWCESGAEVVVAL